MMPSRTAPHDSLCSTVLVDGAPYRVVYVPVGASWRYDVTTADGTVLGELGRAPGTSGLPWRVVALRSTFDGETVERVLRIACADRLVTGHSGLVRGTIVEVRGGFVTVSLETGGEVSVPCADAEALEYARAIDAGEPCVRVELRDGVPLRVEHGPARAIGSYPPPCAPLREAS